MNSIGVSQIDHYFHCSKKRLFAFIMLALSLAAAYLYSTSPAWSQQPSTSGVEYRHLHPEARKLIIDEIRVQLQNESDAKWKIFWETVAKWAAIGSAGLGILAALFGALGWRGLANMRSSIKGDVVSFVSTDADFRRAIDQKLMDLVRETSDTTSQRLKREISLARLELVARKVDDADSIAYGDRMAMVEALIELGDAPDILQTEAFKNAAHLVIRNFDAADIDSSIDELDNHLRGSFLRHTGIAQILVRHYGERMLEADIPGPELTSRYSMYEEAIRSEKRLDWMPFRLAMLAREETAQSTKSIASICKSIKYLDNDDKAWLLTRILSIVGTSEDEIRTHRRASMVEAVRNFWGKHKSTVEAAYSPELLKEVLESLADDTAARE